MTQSKVQSVILYVHIESLSHKCLISKWHGAFFFCSPDKRRESLCAATVFRQHLGVLQRHEGHWACATGPGTSWHCAWWERWEVVWKYEQKANPCWSWAKVPLATPGPGNTQRWVKGKLWQFPTVITLWVSMWRLWGRCSNYRWRKFVNRKHPPYCFLSCENGGWKTSRSNCKTRRRWSNMNQVLFSETYFSCSERSLLTTWPPYCFLLQKPRAKTKHLHNLQYVGHQPECLLARYAAVHSGCCRVCLFFIFWPLVI